MHCPLLLSSAPSINTATSEKKLWSRDSNLGRLGEERERYNCAMPTPVPDYFITQRIENEAEMLRSLDYLEYTLGFLDPLR